MGARNTATGRARWAAVVRALLFRCLRWGTRPNQARPAEGGPRRQVRRHGRALISPWST